MRLLLIGANGRFGKAIHDIAHEITIEKIGSPTSNLPHNITPFLPNIDCVLDVSTPAALQNNLPKIVAYKKPLVIGITGHTQPELAAIHEAAKKIPVFLSANFSPGIALIKNLISHLPQGSYEITERHHLQKKDRPSGTALDLANHLPSTPKITSHREGTIIGHHTITLHLSYENIELSHEVFDRKVFAEGALLACSFLFKKPPGLYTSLYA